ncbi:MAG: RecQ family ATP-dependent DNA helicase [Gammaproteobacteria bacterium]|nr:RecQ family ATP-dependent DNA helicase [Gammaproteobacteria bacterium]
MTANKQELETILKSQFGFDQFRSGQFEAIRSLLDDDRLLCIQPTGYGKSLLYQLPAVLLEGMTLVISPLLALMRDQILHLSTRFNIPAASINSDQSDEENYNARKMAEQGKVKILFVAPEQLDDIDRLQFLLSLPVSLIVIDEAHCISTWGHDFRPSYRQIVQLVQKIEQINPTLKVLGLTATANHKTELDIKQQLTTVKPIQIQRASMDRPNIELTTVHVAGLAEKLALIVQYVTELDGDGLIYCATRENTEIVAEFCQSQNIKAIAYHAGIDSEQKRKLQTNFIKGEYKVIAATNALGMGIDKPDLRFIIHFDFPGSITAYYQEIGRAGRDGLPAKAVLLFDHQDRKIQQHFINSAQPQAEDFHKILAMVSGYREPPSLMTIKRITGLHPTRVIVVVAELVEQNFLQKIKYNGKQCYELTGHASSPDLSRYSNQYEIRVRELEQMLGYGELSKGCRMMVLRQVLGDSEVIPCGHCDLCVGKTAPLIRNNTEINGWLTARIVKIKEVRTNNISEGVAILDGKLRSPLFIQFMRQRAAVAATNMGLSSELLQLVRNRLKILAAKYNFAGVVAVPSRTWSSRVEIARMIAEELGVDAYIDLLTWKEIPAKRQGELLNNDQRRYNVDKNMTLNRDAKRSNGQILLLDDYIGSGATIKEAARVLRKEAGFSCQIIPFAIAAVKWRLGQSGMI